MSMKPKALVVEDGNKSKLKIRASSWIEKITFTDFRAHTAEEEIFLSKKYYNRNVFIIICI
jgi:hypothetical protein